MLSIKKINVLIFLLIKIFLFENNRLEASINKSENDNKITRVVALTSLSADIVRYLSHESLVGIPSSSLISKNNKFASKTIISKGRMPPNLEKIVKLNPDIVIGSSGFHDKTLKSIQKLGIKTLSVKIKNFNDLEKMFSDIQILVNKNKNLRLNKLLNKCYNSTLENQISNKKEVLVLVSSKPILSPNSKSWAGNLINRFDYINITSEMDSKSQFKGYVNLSPEWVIKSKPSNLIIISTPGSNDNQYKQMSIWNNLPAVRDKNVFSFDYYGLINPGSLDSINEACNKLLSI